MPGHTDSKPRVRLAQYEGTIEWLLTGAIMSASVAVAIVAGGSDLPSPLRAPLSYRGDALAHAAILQQAIEGNPLAGDRLSYPFGSNWFDWPSLDWGILGVAKLLSFLTQDWVIVFNTLFFLGFPLAFGSAFLVARRFGIVEPSAFVIGLAYALSSYHFERMLLHGHLFLTWYWVAPIYIWLAWTVARGDTLPRSTGRALLSATGIALLTAFGLYYTAFGVITVAVGALFAVLSGRGKRSMRRAGFVLAPLLVGSLLQVAPLLVQQFMLGRNSFAGARSPIESEMWALRPIQLLLPHLTHRIPELAAWSNTYDRDLLHGNESAVASVGLLASVGLVLLLLCAVMAMARVELDDTLRFLTVTASVLLAFAVVGGLGTLSAYLAVPGLRSWNRLSVFLAYLALLALFLAARTTWERLRPQLRRILTPLLLVAALGFIWVDQTPGTWRTYTALDAWKRASTIALMDRLEQELPAGSAIYQLPYTEYPEDAGLTCPPYEAMKPYLESSTLRFSSGGMKGRDADNFYRALAKEPLSTQLTVIRRLGFAGIYIDCLAPGSPLTGSVQAWSTLLGPDAALWRSDRGAVFFRLSDSGAAFGPTPASLQEVIARSGFRPDQSVR